jgi:predicted RNA polymerase sigma factor
MPDLYLWRRLRAGRLAWGVPLQAAIAACHACAETAEATDWMSVAEQYEGSARVAGSPVSWWNRAVALGMAYGPEAG